MRAQEQLPRYKSIKLNLLLLLSGITLVAVLALAIIAVNSAQVQGSNAQKISTDALLSQAREYLLQLTKTSARENDLILQQIRNDAEKLAQFVAAVFENPSAFATRNYWQASEHLFAAEGGQYMNSKEDTSSILVPNFRPLDDQVLRDVELSAYLDLVFESVFKSNPSTDAIYFASERDVTRYYPNVGLGELVPPDFAATQRVWYTGSTPENNPRRSAWWTEIYVDATGLGLVTTAAAPVYDSGQNLIGVVGIDVTLTDMVAAVEASRMLQSGYSFLIDNSGHAIALPDQGYNHILGRGTRPDDINTDLTASPTGFAPIIGRMMAGESGIESLEIQGKDLFIAYSPLDSTGWSLGSVVEASDVLQSVAFLEEELEQNTRVLLLSRILPVSLIILALVIGVGLMMTNRIVNPIQQLAAAALKIRSGQWNVELPPTRNDEIGVLGQAFKAMADQLYEMVQQLEERVRQRTQDVERRSDQIHVAAEVARDVTATRQLDVLLNRTAHLVRDRFGFYHAGIFLIDQKQEFAVLKAATGEAGRAMLEAGHKLKVGEVGIVGYVTATGRPRISLDVGADAAHFKNPLLPDTHSEMALPLKAGQKVIGALDVQSEKPSAFDQDDITILQIMADQLAVAIENARLFQEAQENLQQLQTLYGHYNQEAWQNLQQSSSIIGYQYDASGIKAVQRQNDGETGTKEEAGEAPSISLPLEVRGQVIGALDVWSEHDEWSNEEATLLKAVGERISQAMESARLFEETQARVAREQTINQLIARFTRSLDFDTLLQTAVQEMGRLPNVSEVSIQVGAPESSSSGNGSSDFSETTE